MPEPLGLNVVHSNPITGQGYTQIPNAVLLRDDLGPLAKLIYGYLSHVSWKSNTAAVPTSRETIAEHLAVSVKQVTAAMRELAAAPSRYGDEETPPLVEVKRRGQGQTNLYTVHDPLPRKAESAVLLKPNRPRPARAVPSLKAKERANALSPEPKKQRARDPLWDALVEALGEPSNAGERGRRNVALKWLRESEATPEQVARAVREYRRRWPGIDLTATALATNWTLLMPKEAQVARPGRVREWVETTGWQYPDGSLAEELAGRGVPPDDRPQLLLLAKKLQRERAAPSGPSL